MIDLHKYMFLQYNFDNILNLYFLARMLFNRKTRAKKGLSSHQLTHELAHKAIKKRRTEIDPENLTTIEKEVIMSTAVIIILLALGLIMPLFWIIGAVTSVGYVAISRGMDILAGNRERHSQAGAATFKGQLGVTMADGGDSIEKEKK